MNDGPPAALDPDALASRVATLIVRHRVWTILTTVVAALVLAAPAVRIQFETSPEIWFDPADPTLAAYHELKDRFSGDEFVVVVLDGTPTVFTNDALGAVSRLTAALADIPGVRRVQSLSTFERIHADAGEIAIDPLIEDGALPLSAQELERVRTDALADPLAVDLFVDGHEKAAGIVVHLAPASKALPAKVEMAEAIFEVVDRERARTGFGLHVTGAPILERTFYLASIADNQRLMPVLYGLVALIFGLLVRRVAGVVYPLLIVTLATAGTLGLAALLGLWLNQLTAMLPMILVAVVVANSVHLVTCFYQALDEHGGRRLAAELSLGQMLRPCTLTSLTTAFGFASLGVSPMPPIRAYGLLAAAGVLIGFVLSMTLLPALLSLGRDGRARRDQPSQLGPRGLDAALDTLRRVTRRHARAVVLIAVGVTALAAWGTTRVRVESVALEFFRPTHPVRVETEAVQELMGGTMNLEILVRGGGEDAAKDPAFLAHLEALADHLATYPEIVKTLSLADFIKRMNRAFYDDDPAFERIPDSREAVAQLLLLYSMGGPEEDLSDLVDHDYAHARVLARMPFVSSERVTEMVEEVRRYLSAKPSRLDAIPTGLKVLYHEMQVNVFSSFIRSFGVALAVITVVIGLSLRSSAIGLMSMVPNILPIVWILGFMGFSGIPLNVGTALVASITLGIAVDDTIHFLVRFGEARAQGQSAEMAVSYVFEHAGRALVTTSLILVGGFWALVDAEFVPMANLGLIAGITIAFAIAADLVLLPALLYILPSRSAGPQGEVR